MSMIRLLLLQKYSRAVLLLCLNVHTRMYDTAVQQSNAIHEFLVIVREVTKLKNACVYVVQ